MNSNSNRPQKVARELQRHIAEIIRSKGMAAYDGAMVTVSPDLSFAKVFVSIFPSEKSGKVMEMLEAQTRQIRGELGRIVAKQLRIVPEIAFTLDTSLDYAEHIDQLLKNS